MPLIKDNILVGVGELFTADEDVAVPLPENMVTWEDLNDDGTYEEVYAEANDFMDGRTYTSADAGATRTLVTDGPTGWRNVGFTQDGVEIAYEPTYGEVNVDQLADAALIFNDGLTVTINTTLVEATLQNLLLAWGVSGAQLDGKTFKIGNPATDPIERQILVAGNAPDDTTTTEGERLDQERLYYCRRIVSMDGATVGLQRSAASTYPVSFRALPDPGANNENIDQEYGWIVDRVVGVATA